MNYLVKYGYLEDCRPKDHTDKKRAKTHTATKTRQTPPATPFCSKKQEKNALKKMQKSFHLNVTGVPDKATLTIVRKRRCGNADSEEHEASDTLMHIAKMKQQQNLRSNKARAEHVKYVAQTKFLSGKGGEEQKRRLFRRSVGRQVVGDVFNRTGLPVDELFAGYLNNSNAILDDSVFEFNCVENLFADLNPLKIRSKQYRDILEALNAMSPKREFGREDYEHQSKMLTRRHDQWQLEEEMVRNVEGNYIKTKAADDHKTPILIEIDLASNTSKVTEILPHVQISDVLTKIYNSTSSTNSKNSNSNSQSENNNNDVINPKDNDSNDDTIDRQQQQQPQQPHIRKKRSAFFSVPTEEKVVHGITKRLFKIMKNEDGSIIPIKWMLLRDEAHNSLNRNARRSALRLAFRIWSEVTPLLFEENEDGLLQDTEIWVVFADAISQQYATIRNSTSTIRNDIFTIRTNILNIRQSYRMQYRKTNVEQRKIVLKKKQTVISFKPQFKCKLVNLHVSQMACLTPENFSILHDL
ncbi:hypothetical protein HELRODRAFT_169918 [Helobdella robusta]|uniref:Peptidoglycan binding-like domain-containing protein n=1 Tax=Helobdella robusta TaxID=6412 RepID=T1F2G1_HELRO|nr:hypothetical protein HELRODRAFT_169918 [Helobdella robusta]ESO08180.1 hypothetical protein HELRODRAFT_169918 [Helobdella robusta]